MPHATESFTARRPRVWCPGPWPADGRVELAADAVHHLTRVLRMRDGDAIELFDGQGRRAASRLTLQGPSSALALLEETGAQTPAARLQIRLAQALAKGDKMDWIIEKAVELGVNALQPLQAKRSVLELSPQRLPQRMAHWQRVVVAAATQCGQDRLPGLAPPRPALQWLSHPDDMDADACVMPQRPQPADSAGAPSTKLRLLLDPAGAQGLGALEGETAPHQIDLAIGPEAGWDPAEIDAALRSGWRLLRVGPRVLRTETAGLAVLAALQDRWGDWR